MRRRLKQPDAANRTPQDRLNATGKGHGSQQSGEGNVLPAYGSTGEILLRIHASDWSEYDQTNDYSFWPEAAGYRASDRITVYLDGKLVWGREPQ